MADKNLLVIVDDASLDLFKEHAGRFHGVDVAVEHMHDVGGVATQAPWADIVLLLSWKPAKQTLQRILEVNPRIEWVHTWWAGVDALLFPELARASLVLTNGRGNFAEALAEFTMAACLYFAKDVPRLLRNQRAACWEPFEGELLAGKTIGIFGYGAIGKRIAAKAKCFGMRVTALKRRIPAGFADAHVDQLLPAGELLELCRHADYLVCSAPLTEATKGILNGTAFRTMKPGAVFINVGRGPVVNEEDLVAALSSGVIKGAALDVFAHEPLATASPLWRMEQVLVSPHCADRHSTWMTRSMDFYFENLARFLAGRPLENVVDVAAGY